MNSSIRMVVPSASDSLVIKDLSDCIYLHIYIHLNNIKKFSRFFIHEFILYLDCFAWQNTQ